MMSAKAVCAALVAGLLWVQPALAQRQVVHEQFQGPVTAAKIRVGIDDGILYLQNQQAPDGSIQGEYGTGLAALAMLAAGAHPATDTQLQAALKWLSTQEPDNTYMRGIQANVWEYALRKDPDNKDYKKLLEKERDWLLKAIGDRTGWRYGMSSTDWDNSCTQYGVLGLWAASRAGMDPGDEFWQRMSKHFRTVQNMDGGWGYVTDGSTPNMATAGLASLFLVFDKSHAKSFYTAANPRTFEAGEAAEVLKALDRGMTWLGQSPGNNMDGYYLYGIERTGVASGRKYFGGKDWFAEGAHNVLLHQRYDGSMPLGHWGNECTRTAFCVLFLVYGGAPVAFNKLEYGEGLDWNLNPRDLANLTGQLWSAYEQPLNWQSVSISAPATELEAPILWISGSKAAKFSEEEMLKLREYILRGGTIFAEPGDHSEAFTKSMHDLLREMFDEREYTDYQFRDLPADHPIYTVISHQWKQRPRLKAVSDGSRVIFLLSEDYLSADWQMNRQDSDAFQLAMNLLFYVTDLGTLEGKFSTTLPDTPPAAKVEKSITVARVRHGQQNVAGWSASPLAWTVFDPYFQHLTGAAIKPHEPVRLGRDQLDGIDVLHLTGAGKLELTEPEQAALKQFAEQGGIILADAYAGSPTFAASAEAQLAALFGKLEPLANESPLAEGQFPGGQDISRGMQFKLPARNLLRKQDRSTRQQHLKTATVNGRPAVFFSEFDLTAAISDVQVYQSLGYKPVSAQKIVTNLLAWQLLD